MTKDIAVLKNEIASGAYDDRLAMLYGEKTAPEKKRYIALLEGFERCFGERAVSIFSAPGRTELCGNHTDHQGGCVLAAAVSLDMAAVVAKRPDSAVRIVSEGFGELRVDLAGREPKREEAGRSEALVRGVAAAIRRRGFELSGFDAYLESRVPMGSGLSSSAAFEVLLGKIFSCLCCGDSLAAAELAQIGQWAENEYFGKPCGLMDQTACASGGVVFVNFADAKTPEIEQINFNFEQNGYTLCITNAGGSHAGLTEEYAAIPREMSAIARCFGEEKLEKVEKNAFFERLPELREKCSDRAVLRAMHFFAENERVKKQLQNLKTGDIGGYLALMNESGRSSMERLQNLWPPEASERSLALALAVSENALGGAGASRVHGGGFAGTIQALTPTGALGEYIAAMDAVFGEGACLPVKIRPVGAYELR